MQPRTRLWSLQSKERRISKIPVDQESINENPEQDGRVAIFIISNHVTVDNGPHLKLGVCLGIIKTRGNKKKKGNGVHMKKKRRKKM